MTKNVDIETLRTNLEQARKEYETVGRKVIRLYNALEKAVEIQNKANKNYGFEEALVTHTKVGENSFGYKWLQQRLPYGNGLEMRGMYRPATNQWTLSISIKRDAPDKHLVHIAKEIETVLPFMKAGSLANYAYDKPGPASELDGWKAFSINIFEPVLELCLREDGAWVIATRNYRWSFTEPMTLMEALRYIRKTYGQRPYSEPDDEEEDY